ncbi:RNA 2',3'-cyclic phosphodiesterase [Lysobacter arvi]|uniref:RNA 2',3'-cyclic phosphodiesterase n=1 Tax=Lysobacter arvi TaxID=3038776 RepID=A0ABU1C976_9GAMM|nr:RNA 2',3'-cyclic phosphodiesterase [Lysobacter arvi]MDR0181688.1 RNA 2',3'-cyclic phosphodiesterase [Lysobacter arvi]
MQMGLGFDDAQDGRMHRLFFALWPDDALRARIAETAASVVADHAPGGRPLKPARYHVTMQFLGDFRPLPPSLLDDARAAADAVRSPAFDLSLDQVGSFRGANVWWLGSQQAPDALRALYDALGRSLLQHRVPVKASTSFAPHLTVQRDVRRHIAPIPVPPLAWAVREFVLIDSDPGRGAPYEVVGRWPLG